MSQSLCRACCSIDPDFFSPRHDKVQWPEGPQVQHQSIRWIKQSAKAGCPLCICLIANLCEDSLLLYYLESYSTTLKRATIDSDQAISMYIGLDDISHIFFSRIPQDWRCFDLAQLGQPPCDNGTMSHWVRLCTSQHPDCSKPTRNFLPTRLLDVYAFQSSKDVKLVDCSSIFSQSDYVALSHCWGSSVLIKTEKGNIDQHRERISFSKLSTTFKDAVKLTSDLGQKYLWIDSLCIIQDDHDDWSREASTMASVYSNAVFTLSALSSRDGTAGCRVNNIHAMTHDNRFFDFNLGPHRIRLFEGRITDWVTEYGDDTYRRSEFGKNPLRQRAWTLQERELSRRSIHFSENMVLWECESLKASSELPWIEVKRRDDFQPSLKGFEKEDILQDKWYALMEDYMSRSLTKSTDKLPALSGLAKSYQEKWPSSQYLAGIWSSHLPHALLWRSGSNYIESNPKVPSKHLVPRRAVDYRAPSWSFLSLDGLISYESQRVGEIEAPGLLKQSNDPDTPEPIFLNMFAQPLGEDKYSCIREASLDLRGKIKLFNIRQMTSTNATHSNHLPNELEVLETEDGSVAGVIYPDITGEDPVLTRVWCLCVSPESHLSVIQMPYKFYGRNMPEPPQETLEDAMIMGLALRQDKDKAGTFRRVGLIRWVKASLFSKVELRTIRLI